MKNKKLTPYDWKLFHIKKNSKDLINQRKAVELSWGEQIIADFLTKKKITFFSEYWFKDCYNRATGRLLFFDFYVPSLNMCIEFHGKHHFPPDATPEQTGKDLAKIRYCRKKGIRLLVVHYKDAKSFGSLFKQFCDLHIEQKKKTASKRK